MNNAGYLLNKPGGLEGEKGIFYNYILAGNGLFIEAENKLIFARIPLAIREVRGLSPIDPKITMTYGSIPQRFFDLALDMFIAEPEIEHYAAVVGDAGYHFHIPTQNKSDGEVAYEIADKVILDIHSHGRMKAFFSTRDNEDERGFKFYAVVGDLSHTPVVRLRIGVYGYFHTLSWKGVFDGTLTGAIEYKEKEVMKGRELHSLPARHDTVGQYSGSGSWRDWWIRGGRSLPPSFW